MGVKHKLYFKTRIKLIWFWYTCEYWKYGKAWNFHAFVNNIKEQYLISKIGKEAYLDMTKREILNTKV